jgi:branched-chain amino acid transport system substrate-binding protein
MTLRRTSSLLFLLTIGSIGLPGCNAKDSEDEENILEIGLLVEFEDQADAEEDISKANMAATEINDAGGISIDGEDYLIRFVAEDHRGSIEGGVLAIESLAERGITAVVGPPWSSITMGEEPDGSDGAAIAARDLGVLLISGSATSPDITNLDDDDLMWRTAPSDALQAAVAAEYLLNDKGALTAALLVRDEAWGRGLRDSFEAAFTAGGGTIVGTASYDVTGEDIVSLDTHDYQVELDAIFAEMPEVILLASFDEVFQITNRIVQGGYLDAYGDTPPLFFGADATFTSDLLANSAPAVLRSMEGASLSPDTDGAGYAQLLSNMEALGLSDPDTFDAARYDACYCIALAMQAAQSTDPQVFKEFLRPVANHDEGDVVIGVDAWADAREALLAGEGINYEGASGPIEFDAAGDPSTGFFVLWKVVEPSTDEFVFDTTNVLRFPAE